MNRQQPYQNRPNHGDQRSPQTRPQPTTASQPQQQQKKTPAFEVVGIRPVENAGALKAYVSVKVGPLTIHDFRIIEQPGPDAWVSVPQKAWTTAQGERKYSPLLDLPKEWKAALTNAVIAAWQDELQKQGDAAL